MLAEVC